MDIESTMRNNYLKCKYVINPDYVLDIYVLSSIEFSNLESIKNLISKLMN